MKSRPLWEGPTSTRWISPNLQLCRSINKMNLQVKFRMIFNIKGTEMSFNQSEDVSSRTRSLIFSVFIFPAACIIQRVTGHLGGKNQLVLRRSRTSAASADLLHCPTAAPAPSCLQRLVQHASGFSACSFLRIAKFFFPFLFFCCCFL